MNRRLAGTAIGRISIDETGQIAQLRVEEAQRKCTDNDRADHPKEDNHDGRDAAPGQIATSLLRGVPGVSEDRGWNELERQIDAER